MANGLRVYKGTKIDPYFTRKMKEGTIDKAFPRQCTAASSYDEGVEHKHVNCTWKTSLGNITFQHQFIGDMRNHKDGRVTNSLNAGAISDNDLNGVRLNEVGTVIVYSAEGPNYLTPDKNEIKKRIESYTKMLQEAGLVAAKPN